MTSAVATRPAVKPNEMSAAQAARAIAGGELTCETLTEACFARIADRDADVKAWAFIDRKLALEQARPLDKGPRLSRLHGVTFGIKDIIDTADLPTEYNSSIYKGHRPRADAACVTLLKQAGCLILGKTETTEFANNHPSRTLNPHNRAHTPGGSSSGSAAAVADWMAPLALGTQTGGSVIRPAAYCGVYAIKPSFGTINRAGAKFVAGSLDTIGVFGREVEDLALALEVLAGINAPHFAAFTRKPNVGVCRTPRWASADAVTQGNLQQAADKLALAGMQVSDYDMPAGSDQLFDRHKVIMGYETARALGWEYKNFPDQVSATLRPRLEEGWKVTRADYDLMRAHAEKMRRALKEDLAKFDFLLTPSAPSEAPASLASTGDPVFNRAWTLLGNPCVTVPYGKGPLGLPLAVQLVGPVDSDAALLGWANLVAGVLHS